MQVVTWLVHWLILYLIVDTVYSSPLFSSSLVARAPWTVGSITSEERRAMSGGQGGHLKEIAYSGDTMESNGVKLSRVKRKGSRLSTTGRKGPRDRLDYRKNNSYVSSSTRANVIVFCATTILTTVLVVFAEETLAM